MKPSNMCFESTHKNDDVMMLRCCEEFRNKYIKQIRVKCRKFILKFQSNPRADFGWVQSAQINDRTIAFWVWDRGGRAQV